MVVKYLVRHLSVSISSDLSLLISFVLLSLCFSYITVFLFYSSKVLTRSTITVSFSFQFILFLTVSENLNRWPFRPGQSHYTSPFFDVPLYKSFVTLKSSLTFFESVPKDFKCALRLPRFLSSSIPSRFLLPLPSKIYPFWTCVGLWLTFLPRPSHVSVFCLFRSTILGRVSVTTVLSFPYFVDSHKPPPHQFFHPSKTNENNRIVPFLSQVTVFCHKRTTEVDTRSV